MNLQSDGEEAALLEAVQPVFVLDVGGTPRDAVRLRDAGARRLRFLERLELERFADGDVGADDLPIVVLESEMVVSPQHDLVLVREEAAFIQLANKVP